MSVLHIKPELQTDSPASANRLRIESPEPLTENTPSPDYSQIMLQRLTTAIAELQSDHTKLGYVHQLAGIKSALLKKLISSDQAMAEMITVTSKIATNENVFSSSSGSLFSKIKKAFLG